jgi:hypothetical protein
MFPVPIDQKVFAELVEIGRKLGFGRIISVLTGSYQPEPSVLGQLLGNSRRTALALHKPAQPVASSAIDGLEGILVAR